MALAGLPLRSKRNLGTAASALLLIVLLGGCGGGNEPPSPSRTQRSFFKKIDDRDSKQVYAWARQLCTGGPSRPLAREVLAKNASKAAIANAIAADFPNSTRA